MDFVFTPDKLKLTTQQLRGRFFSSFLEEQDWNFIVLITNGKKVLAE